VTNTEEQSSALEEDDPTQGATQAEARKAKWAGNPKRGRRKDELTRVEALTLLKEYAEVIGLMREDHQTILTNWAKRLSQEETITLAYKKASLVLTGAVAAIVFWGLLV